MIENKIKNIKEQFKETYKLTISLPHYFLIFSLIMTFIGIQGDSVSSKAFDLDISTDTYLNGLLENWNTYIAAVLFSIISYSILYPMLLKISHQKFRGANIRLIDGLCDFKIYKELFLYAFGIVFYLLVLPVLMKILIGYNSSLYAFGAVLYFAVWVYIVFRLTIMVNIILIDKISFRKAASESNRRMKGKGIEMLCHVVLYCFIIYVCGHFTVFENSKIFVYFISCMYFIPLSIILYEQTKNKPYPTAKEKKAEVWTR
ncbi:hypothetical protein CC99x_010250 [Candidatus Berkiella cookevillensis]|nr:hypothetical protein [Candidatus Berkiella cookevillensis]MCS5709285.1 hypothetical protein [Candidatus Berkiella cookevillensis]